MARTRHILVMETTGKAASQGGKGHNRRFGLRAKLAAGVAVLGCAAALALGGMHLGHSAQSDAPASAAARPATSIFVFSPIGRTGPSDEYSQADGANALPIPQRTGPADEYTQADGTTPAGATHGTGPADEYDR